MRKSSIGAGERELPGIGFRKEGGGSCMLDRSTQAKDAAPVNPTPT